MIDIRDVKKELSKNDKYAIKWFNENGFDGKIVKMYVSKTVFQIFKDGVEERFELPNGIENIAAYMKQYESNWNLICQLRKST